MANGGYQDITPKHAGDDATVRRDLIRRMFSMSAARQPYEAHWAELARYTQPRLGSNLNGARRGKVGSEVNSKLMNDQGIWASEVMANGMATGMTSASMPWFRITTDDPDLRKWQDVKIWLDTVQDRLYGFFARTNFYTAQKEGYLETGVFGTGATVMVEDPQALGVNWTMTAGDYWIALGADGVANTLYRRCDMTSAQLLERFGADRVSADARNAYSNQRPSQMFPVYHAIEPNNARLPDTSDNKNMPFRSIYWQMPGSVDSYGNNVAGNGYDSGASYSLAVNDPPLLEYSGFTEKPFWAPRWSVKGSETYGRGPSMNALPTLRSLQIKELRAQQGADYMIRPSLYGPTALNNVHAALIPGGVTTMAGPDKAAFGPIWQVDPKAVELLEAKIERLEQKVDRAHYANLFMAITNMPGVQPRNIEEIARRNEEALAQLGPAVDRNHNEQLRIAIHRAFGIIQRLGWLPPMPTQLHGQQLRIEFTSILAQMQRAVGLQAIERFFGFVGSIAGEDPSILDKINRDEAIDEYGDRVGVPARIIVSEADVTKLRNARSAQQQAAQAASIAPAAKDGAAAAKLLAEAQHVSGGNMVGGSTLGA